VQRVIVIGVTGSGKSTLAHRLGALIEAPVVELDDLHWLPGWQKRNVAEFRALTAAATETDRWIVVGNYGQLRDLIWPRADTVVWLDYGFWRCLRQLLSRCVRRVVDQQVICNGNRESWRQLLSRDSIVLWLLRTYRRRRRDYPALVDGRLYPNLCAIRLRHPRQAAQFLAAHRQATPAPETTARTASPGPSP